ncbi:hypothetical protein V5O48_016466 [Marasmius crinis-equi]|uniref:Uncharacterized protein n=1 Tax=Marasmius crinis-equi TaxID=585013 RepID=A0ABR3ERM3_9AGAR
MSSQCNQLQTPRPTQATSQQTSRTQWRPEREPSQPREPQPLDPDEEDDKEKRYQRARMILQGLQCHRDPEIAKPARFTKENDDEEEDKDQPTFLPPQEFDTRAAANAAKPIICSANDDPEQKHLQGLFDKLMRHCDDLREFVDTLHEQCDDASRVYLFKRLKSIASTCKSTDSTNLFAPIIEYIPKRPKDRLKPHLPATALRQVQRGINHPDIAALGAGRHLHKYVSRPRSSKERKRVISEIQNHKVPLLASNLQWFLYSHYDPANRLNGLFKGHIMFRVGFYSRWVCMA